MSQFSYDEYQNVVSKAQSTPSGNLVRVGYFKLKEGEQALVRLKITSLDDLKFATVHKPAFGKKFEGLGTGFTPVSCLNEVGSYSDACPFCKAAAEGHDIIGKATKVVYILMMVAYMDPATGQYSAPIPVVWERPAGFSRELASKLRDYGNLSEHVFKLSRLGSGKDTRYTLDYVPLYDKPEFIPVDFKAFDNFSINKHSYYEKSAADLQYYLDNGTFQTADSKPTNAPAGAGQTVSNTVAEKKVEDAANMKLEATYVPAANQATVVTSAPVTKETKSTTERPARTFDRFSF
jgi:hypothetical protein